MNSATHDAFLANVLGGIKEGNGMASFADLLNTAEAQHTQQYLIAEANAAREQATDANPDDSNSGD